VGTVSLLSCRDLACHFGGVRAVDGLDLDLDGGTCVAVVGGNGSGKSTLLDLLSGIRGPTRGVVSVDGRPMPPSPGAFAARGIRRSFQDPRLVGHLSVDENIALGLGSRLPSVLGIPRSRRAFERREVAAARNAVGLDLPGSRPASELSYGERKRVELARVLVSAPRVALLDEPLAGVAAEDRRRLLRGVRALVEAGAAVVLVEHDAGAVAAVADVVLQMEGGRATAPRVAVGAAEARMTP